MTFLHFFQHPDHHTGSMLQQINKVKSRFILPVIILPLLILSANGCALPRYTAGLDNILEKSDHSTKTRYRYRCTIGAHRGASEQYRENTLTALKAADTTPQYAFIEFDVQYSKDKRIVVYHDKTMFRLYGSLKAIGNSTFDELNDITNSEIAEYKNVMDILGKKLNIEIKSRGDQQEDEALADEIIMDIQNRKRDKDVLISAISADVIKYINRKYPDIPTGQIFWLKSSTFLHFDGLTKSLYEEVDETQADYLMLHVANLRNIDNLLAYKPKGKTIVFWDFDDTMVIVHKDLSDRLWGDSGIKTFYQMVRFKIASLME